MTRHNNKLATYRKGINLVSEVLREIEAIETGKQNEINPDVEYQLSLDRNKVYGNIALVSNQEVMDRYNELLDYLICIYIKIRSSNGKICEQKQMHS